MSGRDHAWSVPLNVLTLVRHIRNPHRFAERIDAWRETKRVLLLSCQRPVEEEGLSAKNQELTGTITSQLVDSKYGVNHLQDAPVASSQNISCGLMEFSNFIRYA
jgi:hypothetical protein